MRKTAADEELFSARYHRNHPTSLSRWFWFQVAMSVVTVFLGALAFHLLLKAAERMQ